MFFIARNPREPCVSVTWPFVPQHGPALLSMERNITSISVPIPTQHDQILRRGSLYSVVRDKKTKKLDGHKVSSTET